MCSSRGGLEFREVGCLDFHGQGGNRRCKPCLAHFIEASLGVSHVNEVMTTSILNGKAWSVHIVLGFGAKGLTADLAVPECPNQRQFTYDFSSIMATCRAVQLAGYSKHDLPPCI